MQQSHSGEFLESLDVARTSACATSPAEHVCAASWRTHFQETTPFKHW